jgi:molybdopterin synthase sulfur carrier subunit
MIRVALPYHLRTLANVGKEIELSVEGSITIGTVLDAVEDRYPMLRGTIRDQITYQRRPFIRFFACGQDLSHQPLDAPLSAEIATGTEPFRVIGAMAGG